MEEWIDVEEKNGQVVKSLEEEMNFISSESEEDDQATEVVSEEEQEVEQENQEKEQDNYDAETDDEEDYQVGNVFRYSWNIEDYSNNDLDISNIRNRVLEILTIKQGFNLKNDILFKTISDKRQVFLRYIDEYDPEDKECIHIGIHKRNDEINCKKKDNYYPLFFDNLIENMDELCKVLEETMEKEEDIIVTPPNNNINTFKDDKDIDQSINKEEWCLMEPLNVISFFILIIVSNEFLNIGFGTETTHLILSTMIVGLGIFLLVVAPETRITRKYYQFCMILFLLLFTLHHSMICIEKSQLEEDLGIVAHEFTIYKDFCKETAFAGDRHVEEIKKLQAQQVQELQQQINQLIEEKKNIKDESFALKEFLTDSLYICGGWCESVQQTMGEKFGWWYQDDGEHPSILFLKNPEIDNP